MDSPHFRANIDLGNMHGYTHSEPPEEAIQILAPIMAYAHLKNCRHVAGAPDYHCLLWNGDLDYFTVVKGLYDHGYRGPFCIEYSGNGDRSVASREDIDYLRDVFEEVGLE